MVETTEAAPPKTKPDRKRRRWPRYGAGSALALLVATGGTGWYFAGEVIKVEHAAPDFALTVVEASDTEVTLPADEATRRAGTWGLHWDSGRAVIGEVVRSDGDNVVRELDEVVYGNLSAGTKVRVDTWTYGEDPKQAHGIDFEKVSVPGKLGEFPGWLVKGDRDTWVIAVHGRNANPGESLRAIPIYREAGFPVLAVSYRNDVGAPRSPDGYHHLGDSEWADVSAAVDYAISRGAKDVVLHGWSMGGAVSMTALRRMDDPDRISGIVLDSPVLDWSSTLDKQASQRWLPGPVTDLAKGLAEWRTGVDLSGLDQRSFAPKMRTPVLLFADTADETVDVSATLEFAGKMPSELLTLVETASGHTASWNEDPQAYASKLDKFLANLALRDLLTPQFVPPCSIRDQYFQDGKRLLASAACDYRCR
ncbi:MAG: alpha/beta hydrolase family protein [Stackebrandtia sp.]